MPYRLGEQLLRNLIIARKSANKHRTSNGSFAPILLKKSVTEVG